MGFTLATLKLSSETRVASFLAGPLATEADRKSVV